MKKIVLSSIMSLALLSGCSTMAQDRPKGLEVFAVNTKQTKVAPTPEAINNPNWELHFIGGGMSTHLTNQYEPKGGYNESHQSLGLQATRSGGGLVPGIQAMTFLDSFKKRSNMLTGSLGYRHMFNDKLGLYGGLAGGLVDTSYYNGPVILPVVELTYDKFGLQGSYLPKIRGGDSVLGIQLKYKLLEW